MKSSADTAYIHFPLLRLKKPVPVLGGELIELDFETFQNLDGDWAKESYFKRTRPFFWKGTYAEVDEVAESDYSIPGPPLLIYNAILAVTGGAYPDPRLSVTYFTQDTSVIRNIGALERTWLLNGAALPAVRVTALKRAAALAEAWNGNGWAFDAPVFSPLRGLASVGSGFLETALALLPLIVSLEGFLVPRPGSGIADRMANAARNLLGKNAPPNLKGFMKTIYNVRSRIIHGDEILSREAERLSAELRLLTGAIVIAAASRLTDMKLNTTDLEGLRRTWSER